MEEVVEFNELQPFLMVSYAHKNSDVVRPVINRLRERGISTWHDENIIPREVWDDEIALHIQNCEIVLCFLSADYLASDNCIDELKYAKSLKKAILPIFITDVQLPPGLNMRITTRQMVYMEHFMNTGALIDHLCQCKEVARCRKAPSASPVSTSAQKVLKDYRFMKRFLAPVDFLFPGKLTAAISVLLVIILAFLLFFQSDRIQLYEDLSVGVNENSLVIRGRDVDVDVLNKLKELESLSFLTFQECDFKGMSILYPQFSDSIQQLSFDQCEGVTLNFAAKQPNLVRLEAIDCGITNTELPGRLPAGLKVLSLRGNEKLSDLSSLSACTQLVSLDISGTSVSSLESIPGAAMETVDFSNTKVSNVMPLSEWKNLITIRGSNTPLISITPLAKLENLEEIEFSGCALLGPANAFRSLRLERLDLSNNCINQLNAFENCTTLSEVNVSNNQLLDASILAKSSSCLKKLDLSGNPLSQDNLQELLQSCSELTELNLNRISMESLPALSHMHKLEWLSASGCGLKAISKLEELIGRYELKYICLSNNYIQYLELLYTRNRVENLTLDLGHNPIVDLVFLPNGHYDCLVLLGKSIDAKQLVRSIEGETLIISAGSEITERIDQKDFEQVVLLNCPLDERVRVEDYYGVDRVTFLENEEELVEYMDRLGLDYHFLEHS